MGNYRSGRWNQHDKRETVENCLTLCISSFNRDGLLRKGLLRGVTTWQDAHEPIANVNCEIKIENAGPPWLRLHYLVTRSQAAVDYYIGLTATRPQYGGLRWWFICPLVNGNLECGRRVGKLYLPLLGGTYFGCRHCYNLTYQSCQENHSRYSYFG